MKKKRRGQRKPAAVRDCSPVCHLPVSLYKTIVDRAKKHKWTLSQEVVDLIQFGLLLVPHETGKQMSRSKPHSPFDSPVIYRGIKIEPIAGRRSPLARAIRDELRKQLSAKKPKVSLPKLRCLEDDSEP
jgi:hypothetical protein